MCACWTWGHELKSQLLLSSLSGIKKFFSTSLYSEIKLWSVAVFIMGETCCWIRSKSVRIGIRQEELGPVRRGVGAGVNKLAHIANKWTQSWCDWGVRTATTALNHRFPSDKSQLCLFVNSGVTAPDLCLDSAIPEVAYILIPTETAPCNGRNSSLEGQVIYLDMVLHVAEPCCPSLRAIYAVFQQHVRHGGTQHRCNKSWVISICQYACRTHYPQFLQLYGAQQEEHTDTLTQCLRT